MWSRTVLTPSPTPGDEKRAPFFLHMFPWNFLHISGTICSMKTSCSRCGGVNLRLPQRYCHACHAAYAMARRPRHVDLPPEQRARASARSYANVYQRRGKLLPEPCSVCHAEKAQKHHDDYSKPLQVVWMCRACHLKHHCLTLHVEQNLK